MVALETSIAATTFVADTLTAGLTYRFTVAARNDQGYSAESEYIDILAAQVPDQPNAPTTSINSNLVDIGWAEPFD